MARPHLVLVETVPPFDWTRSLPIYHLLKGLRFTLDFSNRF